MELLAESNKKWELLGQPHGGPSHLNRKKINQEVVLCIFMSAQLKMCNTVASEAAAWGKHSKRRKMY